MHSRLALAALAVVLAACTRTTNIGEMSPEPPRTLTLTGSVCTQPPNPNGFPTRVVLLVEQSGNMCITDPPGSQQSNGFCEQYANVPPGVTQPARVRFLNRLLDAMLERPDIEVALVPYETNVIGPWPSGGRRFGRPDSSLRSRVNTLQAELGRKNDLQGALAFAWQLIESDVRETALVQPAVLPRSRYLILSIAGTPPSPRCAFHDALSSYADDLNPDGTWADDDPACNLSDPQDPDAVAGFVPGTDRNQPAQLFAYVEALNRLREEHHVGSIQFDSIYLSNPEGIARCGALCADLFGPAWRWPGPVPVPSSTDFGWAEGRHRFQGLAARGGGVFREFVNLAGFATLDADDVNLAGLASINEQRALFPELLHATARQGEWVPDVDADGTSDADERAAGTSPLHRDSDGDGFDDTYELRHRADGFDPLLRDGRGCDPAAPLTLNCALRDVDCDGLTQFAEQELRTNPALADSDADGLPDGLEVKFGLDPTTRLDPATDSDGDGVTDLLEVRAATDPHFADARLAGISVSSTQRVRSDGTVCSDFTVTGLPMVQPDSPLASSGLNLFKLWFEEAPTLSTRDHGEWKASCAYARRDDTQDPPLLLPAGLVQRVEERHFQPLPALDSRPEYETLCVGQDVRP